MNGRAHAATSLLLAVPTGLSAALVAGRPVPGLLVAVGCAAGVLISPDLDQDGITMSETYVYAGCGSLPGLAWRFFWYPYALIVPHRHWTSHAPILGTLGRLVYLLAPGLAVAGMRGWLPEVAHGLTTLWPIVVGLVVSDAAHWLMDKM